MKLHFDNNNKNIRQFTKYFNLQHYDFDRLIVITEEIICIQKSKFKFQGLWFYFSRAKKEGLHKKLRGIIAMFMLCILIDSNCIPHEFTYFR